MVPCFMFTLSLEGLSSQSNPSPVFSHLGELCVSAFSSLLQRCHPACPVYPEPRRERSRREHSEGSAFHGPYTLSCILQKSAHISPFLATLTITRQITENKTTLSLVFATLTGYVKVNPCVCHSYKKHRGVGVHRLQTVRFLVSTTHYPLLTTHFFPIGNKLGSAGGESAMASSSGYCTRNGSGTFTLERFKMLINWRALTTPLPW